MRPSDLNLLFSPASSLRGVGPKTGAMLDRLLGADKSRPARVLDLTLRSAHPDGRLLRSPADATEEHQLRQIDQGDDEQEGRL